MCICIRLMSHMTEVHPGSPDRNRGSVQHCEGGRDTGCPHQELTAHQDRHVTHRKGTVRLLQLDVQRPMQPAPPTEPTRPRRGRRHLHVYVCLHDNNNISYTPHVYLSHIQASVRGSWACSRPTSSCGTSCGGGSMYRHSRRAGKSMRGTSIERSSSWESSRKSGLPAASIASHTVDRVCLRLPFAAHR